MDSNQQQQQSLNTDLTAYETINPHLVQSTESQSRGIGAIERENLLRPSGYPITTETSAIHAQPAIAGNYYQNTTVLGYQSPTTFANSTYPRQVLAQSAEPRPYPNIAGTTPLSTASSGRSRGGQGSRGGKPKATKLTGTKRATRPKADKKTPKASKTSGVTKRTIRSGIRRQPGTNAVESAIYHSTVYGRPMGYSGAELSHSIPPLSLYNQTHPGTMAAGPEPNFYDAVPGTNVPKFPFFTPTQVEETFQTQAGVNLTPEINIRVEKGFFPLFPVDEAFICYRRNYLSLTINYKIDNLPPGEPMFIKRNGHLVQVKAMGVNLSGIVDGHATKEAPLVQHTAKRDKGPQLKVKVTRISPTLPETGSSHSAYDPRYSQPPSHYRLQPMRHNTQEPSTPYDLSLPFQHKAPWEPANTYVLPGLPHSTATHYTFDRVQFTKATANNGKRRAQQQYYRLLINLHVDIRLREEDPAEWVRVASRASDRLICRGRSPSHYWGQCAQNPQGNPHSDGGEDDEGEYHQSPQGLAQTIIPPQTAYPQQLPVYPAASMGYAHQQEPTYPPVHQMTYQPQSLSYGHQHHTGQGNAGHSVGSLPPLLFSNHQIGTSLGQYSYTPAVASHYQGHRSYEYQPQTSEPHQYHYGSVRNPEIPASSNAPSPMAMYRHDSVVAPGQSVIVRSNHPRETEISTSRGAYPSLMYQLDPNDPDNLYSGSTNLPPPSPPSSSAP